MEEEAEKLKEMQNAVDLKMNMSSPTLCKYFFIVTANIYCAVVDRQYLLILIPMQSFSENIGH